MVVMFEDNEKSGISKLLIRGYENKNIYVSFTNGDENIINKLDELDDTAIVYIDVVPDKGETIEAYNWVVENINLKSLNAYAVPIPCIEYYVVKAFMNEDMPYVKCILQGGNYKNHLINSRGNWLSDADFEAYCKSVVKNFKGCFRNKGKFYYYDCLCEESKYRDDCYPISVYEKGCRLVRCLPAYTELENARPSYIGEVIKLCQQKYYDLANKYVEYGIINVVQNLNMQKL